MDMLKETEPLEEMDYAKFGDQVLSIKLMEPLFKLQTGSRNTNHKNLFEEIDVITVSIALFDRVLYSMDFNNGAKISDLRMMTVDVISQMLPHTSEDEVTSMSQFIIDGLTNAKENYVPFKVKAWGGDSTNKVRTFRYLEPTIPNEGDVYFRLTQEGSLLFFSGLESESRIGTMIDQLRVKLMMDRGETKRAVMYARQLIKRSLMSEFELDSIRSSYLRNNRSIHFSNHIYPFLKEVRDLFTDIQSADQKLKLAAQFQLDNALDEDYLPLKQLVDILGEVSSRHVKLFNKVDGMRKEYQEVIARPIVINENHFQINIEQEVLEPLIKTKYPASLLSSDKSQEFCSLFLPWVNQKANSLFDPMEYCEQVDEQLREYEGDEHSSNLDEKIVQEKNHFERVSEEMLELIENTILSVVPKVGNEVRMSDVFNILITKNEEIQDIEDLYYALFIQSHDQFSHQFDENWNSSIGFYANEKMPVLFGISGHDFNIIRIKE